jgi:hypothetical protein
MKDLSGLPRAQAGSGQCPAMASAPRHPNEHPDK